MILNKADRLFFTNDKDSIDGAKTLYSRILRRLAFLPTLIKALTPSTKREDDTPQIKLAYDNIEANWQLTVSALTQLQAVYNQAIGRLNKIALGEDMFGMY